ncbi:MAG: bifunctional salicylyl-CoA 5-hydroxylase/oxidoreductase [Acidobacteriota bacterium]
MKIAVIGGGPAGLYFALLMKRARPRWDVEVIERNPAGVTWGWGVVFSDETLEHFRLADRETYDKITASFAKWDKIDVSFRGEVIRSGGHVFSGIRRMRLLEILQDRCAELEVALRFETEVEDPDAYRDRDLVVGADGINSVVRTRYADRFEPTIEVGRSPYIWLATEKVFEAFTFIIRENEHGMFQVHAYPFDEATSTFIVETDEDSWLKAGLDKASEADSVRYCRTLFAPELEGHRLLSNKSSWIRFRHIQCKSWHHANVVLIGDAAHTAHFSIGSGTKLAMEDSIALVHALEQQGAVPQALNAYHEERWLDVAKKQRVARTSQRWFEQIKRRRRFEPQQFTVSLLSRSRKVTHSNLRIRDPAYIAGVDRWFAQHSGCPQVDPPPPPMFTPFSLRGMRLSNRIVVSPMCQYSATDGLPNDWHLVHLGSRAVGGAGLVMTEMTDVSREGRITPGCTGMYKEEHVAAWKRIVDFVHANSIAKIGLQLAHAGRKGSTKLMWVGMDEPLEEGNWPLMSASAIPWSAGSQVPRQMDRADMDKVRDEFVRAASMAQRTGFDMIELHFAHGYLLSSFISPLTNRRDDIYGGSLQNRMRYPLEVFDAVREIWPDDKPMSVRISATDWIPGGFDDLQAVEGAGMLKEHGCDIIDVSSGMTTPEARAEYGSMFQTPFADRIRNKVGIPTMAVGAIRDYDQVNTVLVSGYADLCALGRPHLFDPYFTLHAAADQDYEAAPWPNQYQPAKPRRRR